MDFKLKNKKILITAGPTWVPIDSVRVISNVATGRTGIGLAEYLAAAGAKVTLLLGPVGKCAINRKIRLRRFSFFNELKEAVVEELKSKKYHSIIHSAAVSDYKLKKVSKNKISSGMSAYRLTLIPTEKIVNLIKKISPGIVAVGFKYDFTGRSALIKKSKYLLRKARLEAVVANTLVRGSYQAYLVTADNVGNILHSKEEMNKALIKFLAQKL